MDGSYAVIKVKYGDILRRFNVQIIDDEYDISIDDLRMKIISLFSFLPDSELILTYVDEDGDIVTLADDDDLRDVVKQALNPLRITVKLIDDKNDKQKKHSSGSSTPLVSSPAQQSLQNQDSRVHEVMRNIPEPVREMLGRVYADVASKASSTSPVVGEIIDLFTRVCSSYLGDFSVAQTEKNGATEAGVSEFNKASTEAKEVTDCDLTGALNALLKIQSKERHPVSMQSLEKLKPEGNVSEFNKASTEAKEVADSDLTSALNALLKIQTKEQHPVSMQSLEKLKPEKNVETNDVKLDNATDGNSEGSSSKAFNYSAVAAALKSSDVESSSQSSSLVHHPKSSPTSILGKKGMAKKEMVKRIIEKHLSRKHHLAPNLTPHVKKHWGVNKFDEDSLSSNNMPAGSLRIDNAKEVDKSDDCTLAPNPVNPNSFHAPNIFYPNMPEFSPDPIANNDILFSDASTRNISAALPHTASQPLPFVRSSSLRDGTGVVIHLGVRCDGCGVYPLTGPRFKSKVNVDYDLCNACFEEIGNNTEYVRMDAPLVYPYQMSSKGLNDALAMGRDPTFPKVYIGAKVKPAEFKLDSRFVQDVNIFDGTVMAPLVPFTKIWQLRNNGTVAWPMKTQLVWVGGDKLSNVVSVEVNVPATGLMVDQVVDVAVDFVTPELPGRYISYWRLASPSGQKFGQRVWVLIQVDASLRKTPQEGDRGFNLNLPPISSSFTNPEITNIDREMAMVEDMKTLEPHSSKKPEETVKPVVDLNQNYDHELKFPTNDSLLVGSGASNLKPSSSTSSVSYPIIDLSDLTTPLYTAPQGDEYHGPPPLQVRKGAARVNREVEDDLVRKLKEMGFHRVDLNKEVLRLSGYDLEQAIDVLSGFP